jgi:hypothetical protein
MKWILSICLVILLSCATALNGEDRIKGMKLKRMVEHLTRIRNLLRNLEEDDTGSEEGPSGEESSASEESEESAESSESGSESSESGSQSSESGSQSSESGSQSSESGSQSSESGSQSSESGSQSSESGSSSSPSQNGTEPTSTTPTTLTTDAAIDTENRGAKVQVLALNNYRVDTNNNVFLFALFIYYKDYPIARLIRMFLTILFGGRFRHLQEVVNETSICEIDDPSQAEGSIKYNCKAAMNENSNIEQIVIHPNLILDNVTLSSSEGEINFSEEAALGALNLQNQTKVVNKMYVLNNGQLNVYSKYFIIKGDIDDYKGKIGDDLVLVVYDNTTEPSTPQNVSCTVLSANDQKYEFKCIPTQNIKGKIYQSPMYFGNNNAISLNMTAPNSDHITFAVNGSDTNGTTIISNPMYRKISSGLSGGAIAGIVIACAVALIIASIIAMLFRKPVVPVNNSSSIIGLRAVDNTE